MEKTYEPKKVEAKIRKFWENNKLYKYDRNSKKKSFVIDTPPPFTSGEPHMGHVLWWTWNDLISRFKRMQGYNVLLPQGWDCHGLPTELQVEKNYNIKKTDKKKFLELCYKWSLDNIAKMKSKMIEMGYSSDWDYEYITDDPNYIKFVQKTLLNLYKKKLLKRVEHPVMWCTSCETTLAKAEVGYVEHDGTLYYIRFPIEKTNLVIATTRPEMLGACVAVFVHPDDKKHKQFIGKKVKLPIYNREVPILPNNEIDMKFGSGVVYLCTYGDEADIKWQKKYKLPAINMINEDGTLNENAGKFKGLTIENARIKIIEELGTLGLIDKEERFKHNVLCHTERPSCRNPIEFIPKKQWSIEVTRFSKDIINLSKQIKWYPPHMEKRLINWIESMDWEWIISRQRVYGTPIPFWYCEKCEKIYPAEEKNLPVNPAIEKINKKCECGGKLIGETDICDGWIDSSISALVVSGYWKDDKALFNELYPVNLRQQGHDIIRTWAYYSLIRCFLETGKKPWKEILINGLILGPDGRQMHKSLGNLILPDEVLSEHGADTIRAGLIKMGAYGDDVPFSWKDMEFTFRFLIKLWNVSRFSAKFIKKVEKKKLKAIDLWILSKLNNVIKYATEKLENYQFALAFEAVHNFVWHELADNYIEMIKYRLYNEEDKSRDSAIYTIYTCLLNSLKLLAPIIPYITEEIYQILFKNYENDISIHTSSWPKYEKSLINKEVEDVGEMIKSIISNLRQLKNSKGLPLSAEIKSLTIECENNVKNQLEDFLDDIKGTMKIKEINFGKGETEIEGYKIKIKVNI